MHQSIISPPLQLVPGETSGPPVVIGNCGLATAATRGEDLAPVWNSLVSRVKADPRDAGVYLDLSTIAFIQGRPRDRDILQARAFDLSRVFHLQAAHHDSESVRVLAFVTTGDYLPNMPIEFMLDNSSTMLDLAYVTPDGLLPHRLPDHDVAFVAIAESAENQPLLRGVANALRDWPRPVINRAEYIAPLTRDGTCALLSGIAGLEIPVNVRVTRAQLEAVCENVGVITRLLHDRDFPIIARPLDSHLGDGLCKLDDPAGLCTYLHERPEPEFYIAPFIDYRSADGLYRKYRVALIDGHAFAVHMAVSSHWMINYINANMADSAEKRTEEARFMADFDIDFGRRHTAALDAIAERTRLDYLPLDCAETADGSLLLFELGTNMIVHAMDPVDVYPYKRPQMEKVFAAFRSLLVRRREAYRLGTVRSPVFPGPTAPLVGFP